MVDRHTHLMSAWEPTPRLAFLSPEPGSGKTRALEITQLLVPNPVEAVNVTPSYLFRKVGGEEGMPTILFDEIDTVFGPKAKENEEIRAQLNAGHRRGAVAGRCAIRGKAVMTEEIPAYCAVALAGLLADLRTAFGEREAMATTAILEALNALDDAPWGDLRGKPLDARGLSNRLKRYQIRKPDNVRIGDWVGKGYRRQDLHDAWTRYL